MADISNVEICMAKIIAGSIGMGSHYLLGSAVSSPVVEGLCRVSRGWPTAKHLDTDLLARTPNVTIFPVPGATRRTTRYEPKWNLGPSVAPTLTTTVHGAAVTIGGTVNPSNVVGVRLGDDASGTGYAYRPSDGDTLATIATAFAGMIPGSHASGSTVTITTNLGVSAVVAADLTVWRETRRQEQHVWVITWCPTPASRDVVAKAVDSAFANLTDAFDNLTDQFPLPDGSSARILYYSSHTDDQPQRAGIWRRDLRYVVSYPSTQIQVVTPAIFIGGVGVVGNDALFVFGEVDPTETLPTF